MTIISKISFLLALVLFTYTANAQSGQKQKPDMGKVLSKANQNIEKAKKDGKIQSGKKDSLGTGYFELNQWPQDMRVPGQFEESQAIAMTWQYKLDSIFGFTDVVGDDTDPLGKVACDLADGIQKGAKVIIRIKNAADSVAVKNIMIARGTPLTNYAFYVHAIDSFWDRDSGPISFYYGDEDSIGMVDMDYYILAAIKDSEGNVFTDFNLINEGGRINDDSIPIALGAMLGYPIYKTSLNDEGGNIISDGLGSFWGSNGTRISNTEAINGDIFGFPGLTIYGNYPLPSQSQFDSLYLNAFGINKHIEPEVFSCDGGTGHIDIYGKLLDENIFILADYTPAINHTDFEAWNANLQLFQSTDDSNGKGVDIRFVPMPRIADGSIQTDCENGPFGGTDQRTYVNGVFVNKNYIMPMQSDPANPIPSDVEALAAFQKAMPGYNILPIDASIMFGTGGALHCITMQIPAENPIFIRHNAISGLQPLESNYVINAFIKNKSGLASQLVYYRKSNDPNWIALPMTALGANNYTARIPSVGFAAGTTVEYFIEATSNNGKTITKPFVAREGGYNKFTIEGDPSSVYDDINEANLVSSIFPNPSDGIFALPISLDKNRRVKVEIFDMLGKSIYSDNYSVNTGLHLIEINLLNNVAGIYTVKTIIDGNLVKSQMLVKI